MFYPTEFFIGLRYTRAKRRSGVISVFSLISVIGIALGVVTLITVLSVMNGFQKELRLRILGMASHATIMPLNDRMESWPDLISQSHKHPEVVGAAPFIEGEIMLNQGRQVSGAAIRGVLPDQEATVSEVGQKIIAGDFTALRSGEFGIVLGRELALVMGVMVGDKITVITPQASTTPVGILPRLKRFTVVGVFEVGMYEYDRTMAFMHLDDAAKLLRLGKNVSGVRLKLEDMDRARIVANELVAALDNNYWVSDWTRRHANFFRAVQTEKRVMSIILALMLFIAVFNILTTLFMVVADKQADIAILRTLGMSPAGIMKIFIIQGSMIGLVGALLGVAGGVALALNVEAVVGFLESLFQIKFLAPDVYYISDLPSDLHWSDVAVIGSASFALSVLATLLPAWKAARIQPAEALRYE